jgi:hypothetical protein
VADAKKIKSHADKDVMDCEITYTTASKHVTKDLKSAEESIAKENVINADLIT